MQKYFITDGKRYIKKSKGKYITCISPVMADTFPLKMAEKILDNSLCKAWKDSFYLEGEDDFTIVTAKTLDEETIRKSSGTCFSLDLSVLDDIRNCTNEILNINIPSREKLLAIKKDLEDAQQFYDNACSDIRHWILNHEPPAHIRTKVYGMQHTYEQERANVKEVHGFVIKLIEADEKNQSISQLQKVLKPRVYTPYTPNTYVYGVLDELIY